MEYLRGAYKEYQRKPLGPFGAMVAKAIVVVQEQGGLVKPELRLQVRCNAAVVCSYITAAGLWCTGIAAQGWTKCPTLPPSITASGCLQALEQRHVAHVLEVSRWSPWLQCTFIAPLAALWSLKI